MLAIWTPVAQAQDSVTGSATTGEGRAFIEFTFDAHSGPSGENPTGTVHIDALVADLGFLPVSCVSVSANRASVVVDFPISGSPIPDGIPNGAVISVQDDPDRLSYSFVDVLPIGCPIPPDPFGEIGSGDIVVTDTQPSPTSKDQCKHGGWRPSRSSRTREPASASSPICRASLDTPGMSEENARIARQSFERICARDIDALLELYDPEVEFLPLTGTRVESGGYRGHAGVRDYFDEADEVWELMEPHADSVRTVGDHVLVVGGCAVRGRGSGARSDNPMAWVLTLRDGKVIRHRGFATAEEAFEAAGLSE